MKDYKNYEYVGGGYFRDKTVPKGKHADIIHAPELVKILFDELDKLNACKS